MSGVKAPVGVRVPIIADKAPSDEDNVPAGVQVFSLDDSRIKWREAKSDQGATYQIGTLLADEDATKQLETPLGADTNPGTKTSLEENLTGTKSLALFNIEKDCTNFKWEVGDSSWKDTSQHVKDTVDITQYCLTENDSWDYRFFDETNDGYYIDTFVKGDHWVKYNSDKPSIVKIHVRSS
ncbi:hypothetical protein QBC46DRAFT_357063 [Diplogelasinospora grovesii]|uniref:Uncharacterized protein n=1 Tax=Diplogelasinospora grovesii TaxID=303347 RepID=A0AAN6N174_9PEZI|nr:hypothetical protein QBC46DRAFT_357063 [Diplogelasinospora grovesii]